VLAERHHSWDTRQLAPAPDAFPRRIRQHARKNVRQRKIDEEKKRRTENRRTPGRAENP
jgi:hypothetical protein